ncbi:MAG: glycoside hydrolase family 3 C-terminal domain-containing protein [Opitutae bacterium]|nr:glycoside hydrolase family 3 C-terminal domain-containing protein [Opitutae bacterium]
MPGRSPVIGPNADQVAFGDYSWTKANRDGVSVLQALKSRLGDRVEIRYAKGCDLVGLSTEGFAAAEAAARQSDLAVVVIGDTSMILSGVGWEDPALPARGTVGEGFDVDNPVPPGVQEDLVKAVVATGKPTVVVLLNGRPYCLPWMHDHVPALLEAFYPGEQQGHAIVDILFGRVNPSGRLPVTLAHSAGQIPCTYDFKPFGRGYYHQPGSPDRMGRDYVFASPAPLWPFGFGLSYTQFAYSGLKIHTPEIPARDGVLRFSFTVTNTGAVAGKVVAQVYWRDLVARVTPPEKRLLHFAKVELQAGESRELEGNIPVDTFRNLTGDMRWVVDPREIEIQVGDNAEDIRETGRFTIGH